MSSPLGSAGEFATRATHALMNDVYGVPVNAHSCGTTFSIFASAPCATIGPSCSPDQDLLPLEQAPIDAKVGVAAKNDVNRVALTQTTRDRRHNLSTVRICSAPLELSIWNCQLPPCSN